MARRAGGVGVTGEKREGVGEGSERVSSFLSLFFFVSKLRLTLMRSDIIFFLKIEAKLGDVAISFSLLLLLSFILNNVECNLFC